MPTILLTNDDGIDSPTLVPLAHALRRLGEVHIVVPDRERSWIAKAISRFSVVHARAVIRGGMPLHALSGTPADCVNLGVHTLFPQPPDLVVSGINLGLNVGLAFLLSSGTVGAALEASIAGLPAIAFSMAIPHDAYGLSGAPRAAVLGARPAQAAAAAVDITATFLQHGFPPHVDAVSVNMPADVDVHTPRRVAPVARSRYGRLFVPTAGGGFAHRFDALTIPATPTTADVPVVRGGAVAITPLRLELSAPLPTALRKALERPRR